MGFLPVHLHHIQFQLPKIHHFTAEKTCFFHKHVFGALFCSHFIETWHFGRKIRSLLQTMSEKQNFIYIYHKIPITRDIFKYFRVGLGISFVFFLSPLRNSGHCGAGLLCLSWFSHGIFTFQTVLFRTRLYPSRKARSKIIHINALPNKLIYVSSISAWCIVKMPFLLCNFFDFHCC